VPGAATRFASAFVRLWGSRSSRLEQALQGGDPAAALDAVLSVKSSSALAGALRLSAHAAGLELALRTGVGDVVLLCEDLLACGDETLSAIGGYLGHGSALDAPAAGRR
jgi:HPt (histidine-containing phosphotransfer) domain-containing protein